MVASLGISKAPLLVWPDQIQGYLWQLCLNDILHHQDLSPICIEGVASRCDEETQERKVQIDMLCVTLASSLLWEEHKLCTLNEGLSILKELDVSLHHALVAPGKVHNPHGKNLTVIGILAQPHFSLDLRLVLEPNWLPIRAELWRWGTTPELLVMIFRSLLNRIKRHWKSLSWRIAHHVSLQLVTMRVLVSMMSHLSLRNCRWLILLALQGSQASSLAQIPQIQCAWTSGELVGVRCDVFFEVNAAPHRVS